jgi:iron-sulfur cluster repair protein YtfE (RIC family)
MLDTNENSILQLMVNHHALLEALFFVFKDDLEKNNEKAKETLASFHWEYEKHMFAEENVIFDFLRWNHPKVFEMTKHLKDEHGAIRNLIRKIETEAPAETAHDMVVLHALLSGHRKDEEEHLYPLVDKELLDAHKRKIISQINEIAPRNYAK